MYWFTARIILLLPDLIAETFFPPKCIQNVAALLFSLASSAVTSVNTEYHLARRFSVFTFTAKTSQGMCAVYRPAFVFLPFLLSPVSISFISHIFSLRLWFRVSFVKEKDSGLQYFRTVTVNQGLHRCLESRWCLGRSWYWPYARTGKCQATNVLKFGQLQVLWRTCEKWDVLVLNFAAVFSKLPVLVWPVDLLVR